MKTLYRLGYYFVGLSLGLVIVSFVFSGKKTSCNYGPQARVLANLAKKRVYIEEGLLKEYPTLDSLGFRQLLEKAQVEFDQSTRGIDSCKTYQLNAFWQEQPVQIKLQNCADEVRILQMNPR